MDPDSTHVWFAGRIVSPTRRSGGLTNLVTTSQPVGGTSFSPYPTYAEGIIADERATLSSGDRCNRHDWAKDYPRHPVSRSERDVQKSSVQNVHFFATPVSSG